MENIITKLQSVYSELKKEKGEFFLFMVMKIDEYTDKWSMAISASWITSENRKTEFDYIAGKINANLTESEVAAIARVGIFQPEEHLVKLITESYRTEGDTPIRLENTKVNGYQIHEAYIFEARVPNENINTSSN